MSYVESKEQYKQRTETISQIEHFDDCKIWGVEMAEEGGD